MRQPRTLLLPVFLAAVIVHASSPFGEATESAWDTLSESVQHRNYALYPWEKGCFSNTPANLSASGLVECQMVQENYLNKTFKVEQPGSYMYPQWEACQSTGEQCMLDFTDVMNPAVLSKTCSQGSVPSAYIDAQGAEDVIAALKFSKATGVPLVVKNTGHDFKGRSSAPGSLAIWTHHMNNITYDQSLTPEGCNATYKAMTVEAGVGFGQVYQFADANNFTALGGARTTVGAAGGWLQGGGHGYLSPSLGLGVDRVLQMRVVTADGQVRVANSCQNSDLFWALRGGGGGTFGVVLDATYLVDERKPVQGIVIQIEANVDATKALWSTYISNAERWAEEGWGGSITTTSVVLVNPALNSTAAKFSMKPLVDLAQSGKVAVTFQELAEYPSWKTFWRKFVAPNDAPVGIPAVISSRLIPVNNFRGEPAQEQLLDALLASASSFGLEMLVVAPYSAPFSADDVSVTPAWRNSLVHALTFAGWNWNTSIPDIRAQYKAATKAMDHLRAITPPGAYQNEADVYEPDYEASFWGSNYAKLLEIKNKYDPDNVFTCHQCIGWNPEASRFKCYL